jgi:predicted nuclease of predicted toxin-antitoxin system
VKVLLDECLPRRLRQHLPGHDVSTVPEMGWAGTKNGALLRLAEPVFDVFITIDGNLQHQQNLRSAKLTFVVLAAADNTLETLESLMPEVLTTLTGVRAGTVIRVGNGQP